MHEAMSKKQSPTYRQAKIRALLNEELLSDQNKIVELLREKYDIDTNQGVVSRDLRKLGIVKKPIRGITAYEGPADNVQTEILKLALVDISHNETTIVIKTHPGLADFVGDCLDQHTDLEIIGCLSGENVVFVAPKSVKNIKQICQSICQKLQFKKLKDS